MREIFTNTNTRLVGCGAGDKFLMEKIRSIKYGEVYLVFIPREEAPDIITILRADYKKVVEAVNAIK